MEIFEIYLKFKMVALSIVLGVVVLAILVLIICAFLDWKDYH